MNFTCANCGATDFPIRDLHRCLSMAECPKCEMVYAFYAIANEKDEREIKIVGGLETLWVKKKGGKP